MLQAQDVPELRARVGDGERAGFAVLEQDRDRIAQVRFGVGIVALQRLARTESAQCRHALHAVVAWSAITGSEGLAEHAFGFLQAPEVAKIAARRAVIGSEIARMHLRRGLGAFDQRDALRKRFGQATFELERHQEIVFDDERIAMQRSDRLHADGQRLTQCALRAGEITLVAQHVAQFVQRVRDMEAVLAEHGAPGVDAVSESRRRFLVAPGVREHRAELHPLLGNRFVAIAERGDIVLQCSSQQCFRSAPVAFADQAVGKDIVRLRAKLGRRRHRFLQQDHSQPHWPIATS